jgi:hypothetical protein
MTKTKTTRKAINRPLNRKVADKAQYERFREFAREHETDEDPETFDQKFKGLVRRQPPRPA